MSTKVVSAPLQVIKMNLQIIYQECQGISEYYWRFEK